MVGAVRRALLLVLIAVSVGCATKPLHRRDWLRVDTPHFEISSALDREATVELAGDLERFWSVTEYTVGTTVPAPSARTRVYAFDGRGFIRPFDVRGSSGYFLPSLRGGVMVLRTGGGWRGDSNQRLRHDYAHWIFRQLEGLQRPLWWDEGFALVASTIQVNGEGAEFGIPRADYLNLLRDRIWISIDRLVRLRDLENLRRKERESFNAQSWALVHYLYLERQPKRTRAAGQIHAELDRYARLVADGTREDRALAPSFGAGADALQNQLAELVSSERFGALAVRVGSPWDADGPGIHALSPGEAASELGWLSIVLGRPEQARRYFEMAVVDTPESASAQLGLGAVDRLFARWEEAKPHYARALGIAEESPLVQLEVGGYYHTRAGHTADAVTRSQLLELARGHYARSIALDTSLAEPHAVLGATYLLDGEDATLGLEPLLRAQQLLPGSLEIELLLANLKVKLGLTVEGRDRALRVFSRTHSDDLASGAKGIMDAIEYR
jgi:tetratricopeptide (TPR) repeat protein